MGEWKLIVPESTTNLLVDTSFALADPDTQWTFAGDGAEDWTRGTTYSYYGFSSATADLGGGTYADLRQTVTTTATSYTLSCMVRRSAGGVPTASHTRAYWDDAVSDWDSITSVGGGWYLCVKTAAATAAANEFGVRALEASLSVDGVQLENKAYRTTYVDGYQEGCQWNGAANTSTSTRSAMSRAGGRVYDLEDDYSFDITGYQGFGMPLVNLSIDEYALLPGGQLNSVKESGHQLTLYGAFLGTSLSNCHSLRQALVSELAHDKYPQTEAGWQPVRLWYTGAATWKEVAVHYVTGLQGELYAEGACYWDRTALVFTAPDARWYEVGNSAAVLDSNDSATLRYVGGRLKSTGQWSALGLTADPATDGAIYTVYVASNGRVYFGGTFTHWNNVAEHDYAVYYDPAAGTWDSVGAHNAFNGMVRDIVEGPDGTIYLCGAFDSVTGDGTMDNIVAYNPTAGTFTALGDPDTTNITTMYAMAFDSSGNLYVVGNFTAVAGIANTAYIARWDGSAWSAVGTPSVDSGYPTSIAIDNEDNVYIGGSFTNFDAVAAADYLAYWNGTAWAAVGGVTPSGILYALLSDKKGSIYICGNFTDLGGDTSTDYIAEWTGSQFIALPGLVTSIPRAAALAPDGALYVSCDSYPVGAIQQSIFFWNGSAWATVDIAFLDLTSLNAIAIGPANPIINQQYDIYYGSQDTTAALYFAGTATITNDGTAAQYPVITVYRSGGTSATLNSIRNETTGKMLLFNNYALLSGETLTIDCRPGQKSITSSMFGPRPDAILANCDFGTFCLRPGTNQITAFVDVAGAPTILAYMEWRDAYRGAD